MDRMNYWRYSFNGSMVVYEGNMKFLINFPTWSSDRIYQFRLGYYGGPLYMGCSGLHWVLESE